MFNTTAKFIVIASPFRSALTAETNMTRYIEVQHYLKAYGMQFENVLGYYREDEALVGSEELSLAIPCKTAAQIKAMASLFCGEYKQDCIAVWNRDSNTMWLADANGHVFYTCGNVRTSKSKPDTQAWTYNGGMYFYTE